MTVKIPGKRGVENGLAGPDRGLNGRKGVHLDDDRGGPEAGTDTENENEDNENNENDEEEEEEDENEGPYVPYRCPGTFLTDDCYCYKQLTLNIFRISLPSNVYKYFKRLVPN